MKLIKSIMSAFAIVLATTACAGNPVQVIISLLVSYMD